MSGAGYLRFGGVRAEKVAELEERLARLGVREQDLRETFVRARGPGGQKVNKTSSAVQLVHVPSGVEVKAQAARSQALNRYYARRMLCEELERRQGVGDSKAQVRTNKIRRQKQRRARRARERDQGPNAKATQSSR
ncbi:MAG: peptide chain release factor-like protein [Myxococcota bacterium]